jgi:undecaprenyl-diphosphatase
MLTDALKVGIAQAFALIPGTSCRSDHYRWMLFGLSRRAATEPALPGGAALFATRSYEFVKNRELFDRHDLGLFGVGFIAAFVRRSYVRCSCAISAATTSRSSPGIGSYSAWLY